MVRPIFTLPTHPWFNHLHFAHLRYLSLGICYPPFPLPLEKHIFRETNITKIKKLEFFYCLRSSHISSQKEEEEEEEEEERKKERNLL